MKGRTKMSKARKEKEPTLLRKLIDIHYEQARRRKALRLLEKQSWSIDFLSMLLVKAGKSLGHGVQLEITDKNGVKLRLTYDQAARADSNVQLSADTDIFNRLDDSAAVEDFIMRHNTR